MPMFNKFKNGKTTHAQAVETKPSEWKKHLQEPGSQRSKMNMGRFTKVCALVGIGTVAVLSAPAVPGIAAIAAGMAALHLAGSGMKASAEHGARSVEAMRNARKNGQTIAEAQKQVPSKLKTFAKQIIKPL